MTSRRVTLDFDITFEDANGREYDALENTYSGFEINCPECFKRNFVVSLIQTGECLWCDHSMWFEFCYEEPPTRIPQWERDNE